jgi:prepilin-type processing-associated H-X9-DG protein
MLDLSHAQWRKSTRSAYNGCVEVAFVDGHVAVRDSKDRQGPVLLFSAAEWQAFIGGTQDGEFDLR